MNKILIHSFFFTLLFFTTTSVCQTYNSGKDYYEDDAAIWLNLHFEKKVLKKFEISLDQKNRINNNVTDYGLGYMDVGVNYSVFKWMKVQLDYVYGKSRNLDGTYSDIHRGAISLILRKKIDNWTFTYRNMVQIRFKNIYTSENGTIPTYFERNKLVVKYDINKRFETYISEELYLPFDQTRNKGLSRSRSAIGLIYNITKKINLEGFFIYQHELNAFNRTNRDFIYGLGYSQQF